MLTKKFVVGSTLAITMMFTTPAWSGHGPGMGQGVGQQGMGPGMGQGMGGGGDCITGLPYEEVNDAEIAGLRYMREEEKLARDIYVAFNDLWKHWTFANILRSEQRHMDMIGQLLEKYQITDPIVDDTPGVFSDAQLQSLYGTLLTSGKTSLTDALRVGATIEDLDIYDLKNRLTQADNEDIKTVYQNLMKGSRNHLRAFVYQLSLLGVVYVPQYLTPEEFQAIMASAPERGPVDENGNPIDVGGRMGPSLRNRIHIEDGQPDGVCGSDLLSRRGGGSGGGYGPGDGTGNGGSGPKDGTGNGRKSGKCVNSAIESDEMILAGNGQGQGTGSGTRTRSKTGTCRIA